MHLGIVAPLPPTPAGAAEWVGAALPLLEEHAEISCFVPDPSVVDKKIRKNHRVRPLSERDDPAVDMLIYHIGNNPHHAFVLDALIEGPTGLVEVHDGSLHHYLQEATLGKQNHIEYVELGQSAHGWAGRRLAELRWFRYRGVVEMFLYDYLQPALDRSRGVIVHSRYAENLVQLRCPRVHTWNIPLYAPAISQEPIDRAFTGVGTDTLLVSHLGFVTMPKRSDVSLRALRSIIDRGLDAHFAFVGLDDTHGYLPKLIRDMGLRDHVTVTGYLDNAELEKWVRAVDVIVNLRAPHVGESSGSLAYGLAAGKPVVVQPIGSWAELPPDVVVRLPVTDDDAIPLADTLFALGQDERLRRRFGDKARAYARSNLDPNECARRLVDAAREAGENDWVPPAWVSPARLVAARTFLESGAARIEGLLGQKSKADGAASREALRNIAPARPHAELLCVDAPDRMLQLLAKVWAFEVDARTWASKKRAVEFEREPGIGGYKTSITPIELDVLALNKYDVIVATMPKTNGGEFLIKCNRALTPQGLVVLFTRDVSSQELDAAGFSPHVHLDHPGWPVHVTEALKYITIGVKASVPAALMS